jgi:hypothetical protein
MKVFNPTPYPPIPIVFRRGGMWHPGTGKGVASPQAVVADKLYAIGCLVGKTINPSAIGIKCTIGAVGFVRLGIYADDYTTWPGALLLDSGAIDTTAAADLWAAIAGITLYPWRLYWLVALFSSTPTIMHLSRDQVEEFCGAVSPGGNTYGGSYEALAYGALPAVAPKTPTFAASYIPNIMLQYP